MAISHVRTISSSGSVTSSSPTNILINKYVSSSGTTPRLIVPAVGGKVFNLQSLKVYTNVAVTGATIYIDDGTLASPPSADDSVTIAYAIARQEKDFDLTNMNLIVPEGLGIYWTYISAYNTFISVLGRYENP